MKNRICLVMVVLAIFLAAACSNKYESVVASAPSLELSFNKDTIVIREKDYTNIRNTRHGMLTLYCRDVAHQLNLVRDDTNRVVHIMYRGDYIAPGKSLPVADSVLVYVMADQPGSYRLGFYLSDRLGRAVLKPVVVNVLKNAPATASFFIERRSKHNYRAGPFCLMPPFLRNPMVSLRNIIISSTDKLSIRVIL